MSFPKMIEYFFVFFCMFLKSIVEDELCNVNANTSSEIYSNICILFEMIYDR